jgi:hypothetical protein
METRHDSGVSLQALSGVVSFAHKVGQHREGFKQVQWNSPMADIRSGGDGVACNGTTANEGEASGLELH